MNHKEHLDAMGKGHGEIMRKLDLVQKEVERLRHLVFTYRTQCRAAMKAQSLGLCKRVIKHALDDEKELNNGGK